jgi:diguanylate cyclase (GGDEF)-like protein
VALAAVLAYAGLIFARPFDAPTMTILLDVGMALASSATAAIALRAACRQSARRGRLSWALIGAGLACWALGDVAWGGYEIVLGEAAPTPSPADAFYLPMYPLVLAGIALRPIAAPRAISRAVLLLDVGIVMGALTAISWGLVLGPSFAAAGTSIAEQVVGVAYPLGDIAIACCLALLLLRQRAASGPTLLVAVGWSVVAVADWLGYVPVTEAPYLTGDPLGAVWFAGLAVIALAAWIDPSTTPNEPTGRVAVDHPWRFVVPSTLAAFAGLTLWLPALMREERLPDPAEVAFVLTILFILVRYILGYRDAALAHAYERMQRQEIQHLALRDPLTNAANRRAFEAAVAELWERAEHGGPSFGLIFVDADYFKQYNDTHGHSAGDQALRDLVHVLQAESGPHDVVARVGGDEFAVLMPTVDAQTFPPHVQRLRAILGAHPGVTASVGGATWQPTMRQASELLEAADTALYAAKHARPAPVAHGPRSTPSRPA